MNRTFGCQNDRGRGISQLINPCMATGGGTKRAFSLFNRTLNKKTRPHTSWHLTELTDQSTTVAVISSCFDLLALPFGNDINIRKLDIFRVLRTLFNTLRTITSATVGVAENERRWRREVVFATPTPRPREEVMLPE